MPIDFFHAIKIIEIMILTTIWETKTLPFNIIPINDDHFCQKTLLIMMQPFKIMPYFCIVKNAHDDNTR